MNRADGREPFWTNGDEPDIAEFIIYDREHAAGGRDVYCTKDGLTGSGGFIGRYTLFPAEFMPAWAIRSEVTQ